MKKVFMVLGICFFLSMVFTVDVMAQLPKEGTSSGTASFSGTFKVLPMGQERVQMTYEVFGVNILDTGEGLFHNTSFRCLGAMHAVKGAYEDDSGFCVYTRPDERPGIPDLQGYRKAWSRGQGNGYSCRWYRKVGGHTGNLRFYQNQFTEILCRRDLRAIIGIRAVLNFHRSKITIQD